jgi:hypothetical protein
MVDILARVREQRENKRLFALGMSGEICVLPKALVLNLLRTFALRFHTEYDL